MFHRPRGDVGVAPYVPLASPPLPRQEARIHYHPTAFFADPLFLHKTGRHAVMKNEGHAAVFGLPAGAGDPALRPGRDKPHNKTDS